MEFVNVTTGEKSRVVFAVGQRVCWNRHEPGNAPRGTVRKLDTVTWFGEPALDVEWDGMPGRAVPVCVFELEACNG